MSTKEQRPAALYAVPLGRALAAMCALFIAVACTDHSTPHPTEPGDTPPSDPARPLISDGAHAGNAHFFFLPPLAAAPTHSGTADGTLSPTVDVCDIGTAAPTAKAQCAGTPVANFATTTGTGSDGVHYDAAGEQYTVDWQTDHSSPALQHGHYYRVTVRVAGAPLGYADITPAEAAGKMYTASDTVALVDGRTLPIRFRIEQAAVYVVGSAGGRVESPDLGLTVDIPEGALTGDLGITVTKVSEPADSLGTPASAMVRLGPEGTTFAKPVTLTFTYDPATRPPGPEANELVVASVSDSGWDVHADERPDTVVHAVRAFTTHFSDWEVSWVPVYFADLSTGMGETTCGIDMARGVWCWGLNDFDQLGITAGESRLCGTVACATEPHLVYFLPPVNHVTSGILSSTCALSEHSSGSRFLWCWGRNTDGLWASSTISPDFQTGVPVLVSGYCASGEPTCLTGGEYFSQISMGESFMCAIGNVEAGSPPTPPSYTYCAGSNLWAQAGLDPSVPEINGWNTIKSGGSPVELVAVFAGIGHACGLDRDGRAYCWGLNRDGELGVPLSSTPERCTTGLDPCSSEAVPVSGGLRFTKLALASTSCGLTTDGAIYCWGNIRTIPDNVSSPMPVRLSGSRRFIDLSVAGNNVCGIATDQLAYCQGDNTYGELGTGNTVSSVDFLPVAGGHKFRVLRGYLWHFCAIDDQAPYSTTYCWGRNNWGQLGDGTTTDRHAPTSVKRPGFQSSIL